VGVIVGATVSDGTGVEVLKRGTIEVAGGVGVGLAVRAEQAVRTINESSVTEARKNAGTG
jgi:hypothetical protein